MGYDRHNAPPMLSRYAVSATGCWEWLGERTRFGYGSITLGQRRLGNRIRVGAHRYFYEHLVGAIPSGKRVCHSCDNPGCVNPEHLWLGTDADNMADMRQKGRAGRKGPDGSRNAASKLTEAQVIEIRSSNLPPKRLAERFNVSELTVRYALRRVTWKHI